MMLERPQASAPRIIFDAGRGRCVAERIFTYKGGREETYRIWWYTGKPPVLLFGITEAGEVVAIRQFRAGPNDILWEIPGGIPEEGENLKKAAIREFTEETG